MFHPDTCYFSESITASLQHQILADSAFRRLFSDYMRLNNSMLFIAMYMYCVCVLNNSMLCIAATRSLDFQNNFFYCSRKLATLRTRKVDLRVSSTSRRLDA